MHSFKKDLLGFKRSFDKKLKIFLEHQLKEAGKKSADLIPLFRVMNKYSLDGGKRIRPYLFCLSFKGLAKEKEEVIGLAVFVELIHLELLILDDIMDKSKTRHNVDTVHFAEEKRFFKKYNQNQAEHFGSCSGMLGALVFAHQAMRVLASSEFPKNRILKLLDYYNKRIVETAYGQFFDLEAPFKKVFSKEDIKRVHLFKTAKYTIEAPLVGGAILAGANILEQKRISKFAVDLGLAFQIVDDLVGMFGKSEQTGKPSTSDLAEGKQTYLIVHALLRANKTQKKKIQELLSSRKANQKDLKIFRELLISTGSRDYSEKLAQNYLEKALINLEKTSYNKVTKKKIFDLANFIVRRDF